MNAGSSTANSADVTSTNGSWDITANTFIATAATPFSAVQVGDWASIYPDGTSTGAVYVAQVTTINSGGLSITLSTTAKYGTKPSSGATGKSCKINGAWASELAPVALGSGSVPAATKVNWKAGTYTITASRTIALTAVTTTGLWFSGYNTTPGDLDSDTTNGLTKPLLAFNATFAMTASGNRQRWSGFNVTGAISGTLWNQAGAFQVYQRVRWENTSSNAGAVAVTSTTGATFAYCWMKTPITATTSGTCISTSAVGLLFIGCVLEGGGIAGLNLGTTSAVCQGCVFLNNKGSGILMSLGAISALQCVFYGATVDGIKISSTPSGAILSSVVGCLFSGLNGSTATTNGINNASGTNTGNFYRACNDYYNVTNPEVGMGDYSATFGQTDSSPVVTSATDMTPVAGSNALAHGFPGVFENQTFTSYVDIGAVQHLASTATGFPASRIFTGR